jgi:hypothetical protein
MMDRGIRGGSSARSGGTLLRIITAIRPGIIMRPKLNGIFLMAFSGPWRISTRSTLIETHRISKRLTGFIGPGRGQNLYKGAPLGIISRLHWNKKSVGV